jgi:uncharacterized protein (DUF302 family)
MDTKSPFAYTVATNKDFKQAIEDLEEKIREKGLRVVMVHDMQGILLGKRHKIPPCKMLEICNEDFDYQVFMEEPELCLMMPCKIFVRAQEGKVLISCLRSAVLAANFAGPELTQLFTWMDNEIRAIIDEAV